MKIKILYIIIFLYFASFIYCYAQYNTNELIDFENQISYGWLATSDDIYITENYKSADISNTSVGEPKLTKYGNTPISNWSFIGTTGFPNRYEGYKGADIGKGQVTAIYIDPDNHNIIYAGSHRGGLWKTTNNGDSWQCLTGHVPCISGIVSIVVHPTQKSTIYIAVSNGDFATGVYKTTDGGNSWNSIFYCANDNLFPSQHREISNLVMDPYNSNNLYLLSGDKYKLEPDKWNYIHRTSDGGATWERVYSENNKKAYIHNLIFVYDDINMKRIVATSDKILVSPDNGLSFIATDINTKVLNEIASIPGQTIDDCYVANDINIKNIVWLSPKLSYDGKICLVKYNFITGVATAIYKGLALCNKISFIKISPTNSNIIYGASTGDKIIKFENGIITDLNCKDCDGSTIINKNWIHTDIRAIEVLAEDIDDNGTLDDAIFTGNDGGVSRNTKINSTGFWEWQNISDDDDGDADGLNVTEFNSIATIESDPELIACGAHDMNCFVYNHGVWNQFNDGDGGSIEINYYNPDIFYAKNTDFFDRFSGKGMTNESQLLSIRTCGNSFSELHPQDPSIVYFGNFDADKKLYKLTNVDENYNPAIDKTDITPKNLTNRTEFGVSTLAISPTNPEVMYVASNHVFWNNNVPHSEVFYRSFDGGNTWEDISTKNEDISSLYNSHYIDASVVHPQKPNELWIGFNGIGDFNKVFHSEDYGNTWELLSNNFPQNTWVKDLAYDPENEYLYAATSQGVWIYDAIKNIWIDYNYCSLPYSYVSEIDLNFKHRKAFISTLGYGAWKADFKFCPDQSDVNLTVSNSSNIRVESSTFIKSTSVNSDNSKVVYDAKDYIELNPGFTSSNNFTALIINSTSCGNCSNFMSSSINSSTESINEMNFKSADGSEISKNQQNNISSESEFKVYPNPSKGTFWVKSSNNSEVFDLRIYDSQGKTILMESNIIGEANTVLTDNIKGFVIIKIVTENKVITEKLLIE